MRQWTAKLIIVFVTSLLASNAFADTPAPSREEAVKFFSDLKKQNTTRLEDTDKTIGKKLEETKDTRLLGALHSEIEKLRSEKKELMLRQDFLDRMIVRFDGKYDGKHPRQFLEDALKDMVKVEIGSDRDVTMWPFLDNLRRLIARVPDNQDRVLTLVEGYMKQTSISKPMLPDEFLANVAYSNGSQSEGAQPMARSEVGAFAEKRLKQIDAEKTKPTDAAPALPAAPSAEPAPTENKTLAN